MSKTSTISRKPGSPGWVLAVGQMDCATANPNPAVQESSVLDVHREAVLSDDGVYRYHLSRVWADGPQVTFVMLNPSTADASHDDPTLGRCMSFAQSWRYGGLSVVNLYAFRATKPADLWTTIDPVGPENDDYLRRAGASEDLLEAAWGNNARQDRVREALAIPGFERLHGITTTKLGQPHHPGYLRGELSPVPWLRVTRTDNMGSGSGG